MSSKSNLTDKIIDSLLYLDFDPNSSYYNREIEDKLEEYENKTNVHLYIPNVRMAKEWLKDEDSPFFDQNLDAIYSLNYGKIIQCGVWNSKGKYLPEYTSLEENGRIITIPNFAIGFVISENHIIELEKVLINMLNKKILNMDCCNIILSFAIDFCRIM
tara:strand:+ start:480 stop:956 length:477 start_codon:yes stop_codon:yes gene_type:complete